MKGPIWCLVTPQGCKTSWEVNSYATNRKFIRISLEVLEMRQRLEVIEELILILPGKIIQMMKKLTKNPLFY